MKDLTGLLREEQDITTRYRITSLVRRRPYVNLYLALDNEPSARGRIVTIRDIDLSSLEDEQTRLKAIELAQQEYDLLRRWQPLYVMSPIDLRYFGGHLYLVAAFAPLTGPGKAAGDREAEVEGNREEAREYWPRLTTLQDFLQSGQGLPSERRVLQMMGYLCSAVDGLHRCQVLIGDLDPYTVILNGETADAQPALMISWLPPRMRAMLPPPKSTTSPLSYFIAPEALQGSGDVRSDIYSLGAIFYLLLTGMPPEESALRSRNRLRTPQEVHACSYTHVSESVMQALALEPSERFQSVAAFSEALRNPRYRRPVSRRESEPAEQSLDVETVRIVPLSHKDVARWRADRPGGTPLVGVQGEGVPPGSVSAVIPVTPPIEDGEHRAGRKVGQPAVPTRSLLQRVTGKLPAIRPDMFKSKPVLPQKTAETPPAVQSYNTQFIAPHPQAASRNGSAWLEHIKHAVLGKQHSIAAAAIIETPLRVLPDQMYSIRLHVIGRDEAPPSNESHEARRRSGAGGLSALAHGDVALIEVRSVLHQSYAYIVQQAAVTIPAQGYVAEVTIPMQPLVSTPTGRRDRLHIFFLNDQRHPLYEKPFVVEIFVSHHVKRGNEGHHVLTIPL